MLFGFLLYISFFHHISHSLNIYSNIYVRSGNLLRVFKIRDILLVFLFIFPILFKSIARVYESRSPLGVWWMDCLSILWFITIYPLEELGKRKRVNIVFRDVNIVNNVLRDINIVFRDVNMKMLFSDTVFKFISKHLITRTSEM